MVFPLFPSSMHLAAVVAAASSVVGAVSIPLCKMNHQSHLAAASEFMLHERGVLGACR